MQKFVKMATYLVEARLVRSAMNLIHLLVAVHVLEVLIGPLAVAVTM